MGRRQAAMPQGCAPGRRVLIEDRPAAGTQLRFLPHEARDDAADIRNFAPTQPKDIVHTCRLLLGSATVFRSFLSGSAGAARQQHGQNAGASGPKQTTGDRSPASCSELSPEHHFSPFCHTAVARRPIRDLYTDSRFCGHASKIFSRHQTIAERAERRRLASLRSRGERFTAVGRREFIRSTIPI